MKKTLIFGYGNPGRQDDGLGITFVSIIEKWIDEKQLSSSIKCDSNYQLNIEEALTICQFDHVIFVDASKENVDDFRISKITPSSKVEFSMHTVSPSYILYLSQTLYQVMPKAYLLHIRGYNWEMKEELSTKARVNLSKALKYIQEIFLAGKDVDLDQICYDTCLS